MNLIALAELEPQFVRAVETYKKVKAVAVAEAAKVHVLLPPKPQQQADIKTILQIVALFVPDLKPLIPEIVSAVDTIEKAGALLQEEPAPAQTWPT